MLACDELLSGLSPLSVCKMRLSHIAPKHYDQAKMAYERVLASGSVSEARRGELQAQYERLNLAKLHRRIEHLQDDLLDLHRRRSRIAVRAATGAREPFSDGCAEAQGRLRERRLCDFLREGFSLRQRK